MTTKFDELMLDPEFRKLYAIEALIADTAQMIADLMGQKNLKQADLARMLNKTPAFVSQLLNGKSNMTLRTLAEVVYALGASVKIEAVDRESLGCEIDDSQGAHTFRLPNTRLERNTHPIFVFGDWEATGPKTFAPEARSGYAA